MALTDLSGATLSVLVAAARPVDLEPRGFPAFLAFD
jgi:hypothetical protein